MALETLEVVEGLETRLASIVSLAGRGTKLAHTFCRATAAARTGDGWRMKQMARARYGFFGRGNAEGSELLPPLLAQPVTAPGRRENFLQDRLGIAGSVQSRPDGVSNDFRRGTT